MKERECGARQRGGWRVGGKESEPIIAAVLTLGLHGQRGAWRRR